jgi:hypothetical protein
MKDKIIFVRTKDNRIIKIDENGCIKEFNLLGKKRLFAFRDKRWSYRFENGSDVIKASENLEELFDEYVWKWNKNEFPYSTSRQYVRYGGVGDLKRTIRCETDYGYYLNQDYEIYGAIWTDKGLLYVARLNDKGEWELC